MTTSKEPADTPESFGFTVWDLINHPGRWAFDSANWTYVQWDSSARVVLCALPQNMEWVRCKHAWEHFHAWSFWSDDMYQI